MNASHLTYGRLDEALRTLGFSVRIVEPNNYEYRHPASGAVIFLPVFPAEDPVLPRHRAAVRTVLQGFGIPEPLDLVASIAEAT